MSTDDCTVWAIVPAAGRSARMGRDKQLIEIGGRPMLLAAVDVLLSGGVERVVVVTRKAIADALCLPQSDRVHVAYNEDASSEMIDSVRIGLDTLIRQFGDSTGFLVCPADHPGLAARDVRACVDQFREHRDRIVIASRAGTRGHPMIFPATLAAFVQSTGCDAGLNALGRNHAELVQVVECESDGVIRDVDRPQDLS